MFAVSCGVNHDGAQQESPHHELTVQSSPLSSQEDIPKVAEELILLGQLPEPTEGRSVEESLHPPYDRQPTPNSEFLRQASLQAEELAARDPDRFYVMRLVAATGEVFAVARSNAEAKAHGDRLAPDGHAPSSVEQQDGYQEKSFSDNVDNRFPVSSSSWDSNIWILDSGILKYPFAGGQCTGALFAYNYVVTAAHCAIDPPGPGSLTIAFSARQRSNSSQPYGTGTTTYLEWETAYTARNCHVNFTYPDCIYYDFAIVGFSPGAFTNPGYLGFSWLGDTQFKSTYNQTVGYPSCVGSSCFTGIPYAEWVCAYRNPKLYGGSTSNSWPYSDGTNPMWQAACDFTLGQSGASLFDYDTKNILGVFSFAACSDSNCTYSALGPRISGPMYYWMLSHR